MRKVFLLFAVFFLIFVLSSCGENENIAISFVENGGTEVEDITLSADSTSVDFPNPTKEGFIFDGWFLDEALTEPFALSALLTQNGSLTLYAKWTASVVQYTITFESNGGSVVSAITADPGAIITQPTNPTKTGYTFDNWYSDMNLTTVYIFQSMPSSNITLYAKWIINNSTISFEENGGTSVTDIIQAIGSSVVAPADPTKVGHTFAGWYSDSNLTTPYVFTTMPDSNITLYAKWTVNQLTISFEENGGSLVTDITQAFGSNVTAPANPTKEGHTFAGWYSDTNLTTAYVFSTVPASNITLYAKWTVNSYTISFEENGG
ncbi:MAG: hypothetical protein CVV58_07130, partial [Tenericutes bacterium HGW-Tenericutes-3]